MKRIVEPVFKEDRQQFKDNILSIYSKSIVSFKKDVCFIDIPEPYFIDELWLIEKSRIKKELDKFVVSFHNGFNSFV